MIKVLNLYAGIGGNRKLWEGVEVTAVEINPEIAKIYHDFFPEDKVIVADAHKYLLDHYKEFDFIWSSPPCPTHSDIRRAGVHGGKYDPKYPDMTLYEEIIFLKHFAPLSSKWIVENVVAYYDPLIKPVVLERHYLWGNFPIVKRDSFEDNNRIHNEITGSQTVYGFNIKDYSIGDRRKILRNMVDPKLALHIFNLAFKEPQRTLI